MSKISIHKKHHMSKDDLVSHAEELAESIVAKYGGDYHWEGDLLHYSYSGGVSVQIACTESDVAVDVKLGMLMSMLKGPITREIDTYLDNNIS